MRRVLRVALFAAQIAVAAGAWAQEAPGKCPWRLFPDFVACDRAGAVLCTAASGLYRFDGAHGALDAACEARRTAGAAVFRLLAKRGERDPNSPLAQKFKRAIEAIAAHQNEPTVDFWAIAYNPSDKEANASLEALLGLLGSQVGPVRLGAGEPQWDVGGDDAYWHSDADLLEKISLGNDYGLQPTQRWREVPITVKAGEVTVVPVRLLRRANVSADGPRPAGVFPIGLFRETALDHYSIDESDMLSLGVAPIEASPGWGNTRQKW